MSQEALQRKRRSEVILKNEGVCVNEHLPSIESEADSKFRTTRDVAERSLALTLVAVKGEGVESAIVDRVMADYCIEPFLTPKERAFVFNNSPSEQERIQFCWRYECLWVALWALGFVSALDRPDTICDVPKAVGIIRDLGKERFVNEAALRSASELLDAADLIYRYHWAVVDARLKGHGPPAGLDSGVVVERHYALNWLIGYMGQEWDDISTDT